MSMFGTANQSQSDFKKGLNQVYTWYTGGFAVFVIVLAILEQMGMPKAWIGYSFLAATVLLYAGIGVMSRTSDASEFYVAGRRVPAFFNGMATGADWMSAASFIGMAIWTLIPDKIEEEETQVAQRFGIFGATFITFFLAEMGDKTQIATVMLAARFDAYLAVVAGTTFGMMLANAPVVWLGERVTRLLPLTVVHRVSALIFAVLAVLAVWSPF